MANSVDPDGSVKKKQYQHLAKVRDPHLMATGKNTYCLMKPRLDESGALDITKTYLYNFEPLKPHFYIVKLGFTGVYIIFIISAQNIDCGYSLEPPRRGGSNEYPQSMFWAEIWKISEFFIWKFSFLGGKILNIFE